MVPFTSMSSRLKSTLDFTQESARPDLNYGSNSRQTIIAEDVVVESMLPNLSELLANALQQKNITESFGENEQIDGTVEVSTNLAYATRSHSIISTNNKSEIKVISIIISCMLVTLTATSLQFPIAGDSPNKRGELTSCGRNHCIKSCYLPGIRSCGYEPFTKA